MRNVCSRSILIVSAMAWASACTPMPNLSADDLRELRLKRYLASLSVAMDYADSTLEYTVGEPQLPVGPQVEGREKFTEVEFTLSPALPFGLNFDPRTGVISGVAIQPSVLTTYTASFYGDQVRVGQATVSIEVIDLPPAPFTYAAGASLTLDRLTALTTGAPQFESGGGAPVAFSVSPALPSGILLNTGTGVISGTPQVVASSTVHTLTATNSGGSVASTLAVEILEPLPGVPTLMAATIGNATLGLSWQAPVQLAGSLETLSYDLERKIEAGAWSQIAAASSGMSFTDSGLTNGQALQYRVRARHSRGAGAWSAAISARSQSVPDPVLSVTPPSIERGVLLDPPFEVTPAQAAGPIESCSVAPALPSGLAAAFDSMLGGCRIAGTPTEARAFTTYTVTAANQVGSGEEVFILEVRDPVPGAPSGIFATIPSGTSVRLQWVDPSSFEQGFRVERRVSGDPSFSEAATLAAGVVEWTETGLTALVPVQYRIFTLAQGVESAASTVISVTPMSLPAAPVISLGQSLASGARIEWSAVTGPGSVTYEVFRDGQSVAELPAGTLEFTEVSLNPGEPVEYTVKAVNEAGASAASVPERIVPSMGFEDSFSLVATGGRHTCRILRDQGGKVECWGSNSHGQIGAGIAVGQSTTVPQEVSGVLDAISVTAGETHTCALLADTSLKCWGNQYRGRLGNGSDAAGSISKPSSVLSSAGIGVLTQVRSVSAGAEHTCATLYSGDAYCWGSNLFGQLGIDETSTQTPSESRPVQALELSGVVQVSAGIRHTCALLATTEIACWGSNSNGGLGDGTTFAALKKVMVREGSVSSDSAVGFREVSTGFQFSCGRKTDGSVKCWGRNLERQLGTGNNTNRLYPASVSGLTGVRQIRSGYTTSCAIRLDEGLVPALERATCWGTNSSGEFGNGDQLLPQASTAEDSDLSWLAPGEGDPLPELGLGSSARHVYCTEGSGWLWGLNDEGQAGSANAYQLNPFSL